MIDTLIYGISKDLPYIAAAKPYKPQISDFINPDLRDYFRKKSEYKILRKKSLR